MIDRFYHDYRFLSNFYLVPIVWENDTYRSVEHAYQAAKSLDFKYRERIRLLHSPAAARSLGKKAELREDWEQVKVDIMRELVSQKFQVPYLRVKLRATGSAALIEGNWWHDTFWGKCYCDKHNWAGENILGKILMEVRNE